MQQQQSDVVADDTHAWHTELRALTSGVNLVVLVLAVAVGVWGVFDSMTDAGGDRFIGIFSTVSPSVFAGWCMLEPALRRRSSTGGVILRLASACAIAPALVAIPIGAVQAIAVLFPGIRNVIDAAAAGNGGFHYHWAEGIGAQLLLVPVAGWMIGACVALGVCIILTLPIISLRRPDTVSSGSHIEAVAAEERDPTTAFVFCGLGVTMLGIGLWVFGGGNGIDEFPGDLARFMQSLSYGYASWHNAMWLVGVVLVVVGALAMAWGCIPVLAARARKN